MNNKGQLGILGFVFGIIIFVIVWAVFLGEQINYWAGYVITTQGLSGIDAFLISNMNLWIGILLFAGIGYFAYSGGSQ